MVENMCAGKRKRSITVFDAPLPKRVLVRCTRGNGRVGDTDPMVKTSNSPLLFSPRSSWLYDEDVVEEILVRLPVKALHRCMSLSKTSRSLILSHGFLQRYRKSRMAGDSKILMGFFHQLVIPSDPGRAKIGFVPTSDQGWRLFERGFDISLRFLEPSNDVFDACTTAMFSVVASSNSFLLCRKDGHSFDGGYPSDVNLSHREYYVCNPLTGQWITLPSPPNMKLALQFETFTCSGDGYPCLDWVTYKVARGSDICTSGNLQVEIFSSQTGEWVALQLSTSVGRCTLLSSECSSSAVMSESDTVCFLSYLTDGYPDGCCFCFKAKQNTNELQIVIPPKPGYSTSQTYLGQSQGFIYMSYIMTEEIELWELDENKGIWVLKYSVNPVEMFSGGFKSAYYLSIDPENSAVVLVNLDERIALVNMKKKSYELTSVYPDLKDYHLWYPYQWPRSAITSQ